MDIEISIILDRRFHWRWVQVSDATNNMKFYGSGWKREMNPDMERWLEANGVAKAQHVVEVKYQNRAKGRKESYLKFKDVKTARHFVLAWNIPAKYIFLGHFDRRVANDRLGFKGLA